MAHPLVIIGTGLAGYMLAKEWRKKESQRDLVLITQDDGAYYSKPQLSIALSKQQTADDLVLSTAAQMSEALQASIMTQTSVQSIDAEAHKIVTDKGELSYSQLVFAVGASPMTVPAAWQGIEQVNTLTDYRHWRANLEPGAHVAVIGSGLVGCEFMHDLSSTGCRVDIISQEATPLALLLPPEVGMAWQQAFVDSVNWHFLSTVQAVSVLDSGCREIQLSSGETLVCDRVLSAIGLRANTRLAQQAGLAVGRGITVDRQLQTSEADVFALGDCAEVSGTVLQYVAPILQGARILARRLQGEAVELNYPPMPIVVKTPLCPVVLIPPPKSLSGEWQIEGEGVNQRALFYHQQQLCGFALTGDKVRDKMQYIKQMQGVFAS